MHTCGPDDILIGSREWGSCIWFQRLKVNIILFFYDTFFFDRPLPQRMKALVYTDQTHCRTYQILLQYYMLKSKQ